MISLRKRPIWTALLLLAVAGCGSGTVVDQTNVNPPTEAGMAPANQQPEISVAEPIVAKTEVTSLPVQDAAVSARTRNPFQPPTIKIRTLSPQQSRSANIRLLGTAKRDSQLIALFEYEGEIQHACVGDFVGQWEVIEITKNSTSMRKGLEQIALRLQ